MTANCFDPVTLTTEDVSELTVREVVEFLKSSPVRDTNFSLILFSDGSSSVVVMDDLPHDCEVWGYDGIKELTKGIREN